MEKTTDELEAELKKLWDEKGVSKERQEELLADIAACASLGAYVGPFKIGGGK